MFLDENQKSSEQGIKSDSNTLLIPGAIIVAGVLIAGAVMYVNAPRSGLTVLGNGRDTSLIGKTTKEPAGAAAMDLRNDDPSLGNPEAPVTVVEFSDFQCPFCRRLYSQTLPQLKEKYIKTGKIQFVYRDFPLTSIHDMAQKYAEAGECADEQGKFWAMHDKIFEEQNKRGAGTITDVTVADVKQWAREIGLNGADFNTCLDSSTYSDEVEKDFNDGQAAGITGTPGTFVNGRLIPGAVPFETFKSVIEEELGKVQ